MRGYKLVKAHPHSIEVAHPDGTTFHVAKHGLDLPMLQKLMKLPAQGKKPKAAQTLADGGVSVQPSNTDAYENSLGPTASNPVLEVGDENPDEPLSQAAPAPTPVSPVTTVPAQQTSVPQAVSAAVLQWLKDNGIQLPKTKINATPAMADGGDVPTPGPTTDTPTSGGILGDLLDRIGNAVYASGAGGDSPGPVSIGSGVPGAGGETTVPPAQSNPSPAQQQLAQQAVNPSAVGSLYPSSAAAAQVSPQPSATFPQVPAGGPEQAALNAGEQLQQQGVKQAADVAAAKSGEEAAAAAEYANSAQKVLDDYNATRQSVDTEYQDVYNKAKNQQINPNRLWQNMSGAEQAGNLLGILVSGLGAGKTGSNLALDQLNKNIDRDIEAQRTNMANTNNLLNQNMQRYRDLPIALQATRAQMATVNAAQGEALAAKYGGPAAQAGANQALGALQQNAVNQKLQLQQLLQNQAYARAQMQARINLYGGSASAQDAALASPEDQKDIVEIDGKPRLAQPGTAATVANHENLFNNVQTGIKALQQINANHQIGGPLPYTQDSKQARDIQAQMLSQITEAEGQQRITPLMAQTMKAQIPDVGALFSSPQNSKTVLDQTANNFRNMQNSMRAQYVRGYKYTPQFTRGPGQK